MAATRFFLSLYKDKRLKLRSWIWKFSDFLVKYNYIYFTILHLENRETKKSEVKYTISNSGFEKNYANIDISKNIVSIHKNILISINCRFISSFLGANTRVFKTIEKSRLEKKNICSFIRATTHDRTSNSWNCFQITAKKLPKKVIYISFSGTRRLYKSSNISK